MNTENAHILLVEDSNTQAIKLMMILEEEGWKISRVSTAEEGLDFLNQEIPNLILVDYYLPGMHGDAFCRQVRMKSNSATRHIPLLMLTSAESDAAQVQGLDSGADDYLSKSEDLDVLILRIRALLRKSVLSQNVIQPELAFEQARILAIDDSPTYLAFLIAELQQEGYLVEGASSGPEGLKKLQTHSYDCILVDLIMPGIDGIEVCQQIAKLEQNKLNPLLVLMLTAHDNTKELSRALAAGADDFVGKASDVNVLKGRVRALLRRKLSQDENQRLLREIIHSKELETQHARKAQEEAEERSALAEELALTVKQLRASQGELEQLATISAHDLQEPLRILTNYSELLLHRYQLKLDPRAQRYLDFILENTQRMQIQVQALLTYLSVCTAKISFQQIHVDTLLDEVLEDLKFELQCFDINLEVAQPMPVLYASSYHFKQLFQNLLKNALFYASPERELQIRVAAEEQELYWTFRIQDNGIGIEEIYFRQIFQIFQQLQPRKEPGVIGMGLPICRKIVELHGGEIWVESEWGKGACFVFTLPKQIKKEDFSLLGLD